MFQDEEISWKELDRKRKVSKEIGPFSVVIQEKEKSRKNFRLVNVDINTPKRSYHYELYLARETIRTTS